MFGWIKRFLLIDEYTRGKEAAQRYIAEFPNDADVIMNWNISFYDQGEFERGWQEVLRPYVDAITENIQGSGLGELISVEEGKSRLIDYVTTHDTEKLFAARAMGRKSWEDATDYRNTGAEDTEIYRLLDLFKEHRLAVIAEMEKSK